MNIKRENIKYVDVINRTITFELKEGSCCRIAYTYETKNDAMEAMLKFVKQYGLVSVPETSGRQYVIR